MAHEGYTIRDYGSECWLIWVGYPPSYNGRRVTHFIAQVNNNPSAMDFAKTQLADDLDARVVDLS